MNGELGLARRWLEKRYPPGSAEDILERLASSLWGQNRGGGPAAHDVLADLLLSWAKERRINGFAKALLNQLMYIVPERDGFRLYCRLRSADEHAFKDEFRKKLEATPQYRWVFAHELAHTFFYDFDGERPRKPYPVRDSEEEDLCNRFASALLMPRAMLEARAARANTVTLEWLLMTAQAFGVSVLELARRLITELGILHLTFALVTAPGIGKPVQGKRRELRSRRLPVRIVSPPGSRPLITGRQVLSSKALEETSLTGLPCISEETYEPGAASYFVEAELLKNRPKDGIACLFHQSRPIRRQNTLFDFANEGRDNYNATQSNG